MSYDSPVHKAMREKREKYNLRRALEKADPKYFEAYLARGILDSPVVKQSKKDELQPYIENLKKWGLLDD